jgi:hypothetical protein
VDKEGPAKRVGVAPTDRVDFVPFRKPSIADREEWSADGFFTAPNELEICQVISSGDQERLAALLDSGVELNTPGKFGLTVLYWAYVEDDMEAFELLLKHGADPDHRLTHAFRWSDDGPVECSGEPELPNFRPFFEGDSILFTGLWQRRPEFCFAALKHTADVNQLDRGGENLIHRFLEYGLAYSGGLQAFIDAGVDVNAKGQFGCTPAHMAVDVGPSMCVQLLRAGADPSVKNDWGFDVAEKLEWELSNMREGQVAEVYDPLIQWFEANYRKIRRTKHQAAESEER